jgi:hypothetical protein
MAFGGKRVRLLGNGHTERKGSMSFHLISDPQIVQRMKAYTKIPTAMIDGRMQRMEMTRSEVMR